MPLPLGDRVVRWPAGPRLVATATVVFRGGRVLGARVVVPLGAVAFGVCVTFAGVYVVTFAGVAFGGGLVARVSRGLRVVTGPLGVPAMMHATTIVMASTRTEALIVFPYSRRSDAVRRQHRNAV